MAPSRMHARAVSRGSSAPACTPWPRRAWIAGFLSLLAALPASGQPAADARLTEAIGWYTGTAGRVDDERARGLIDAAARDGDVLARMWVARAYSRGRLGYPRDPNRARVIAGQLLGAVRRQADAGSVEAAFLMGTAYDEGLGVNEDPAAALGWLQKAAAGGHTLAEHNIGNAYFAGRGVAADLAAAVTWWTKAAAKGDAVPQLRLGEAYETGRGVAVDLDSARRWYADAAARGNAAAKAALKRLGGGR
ncbi:MAG: tetratricopeptide repeat protein [Vicinamibacterales bacterium]